MSLFGNSWVKDSEHDHESMNDARVRRYKEDTPLFPEEDLTKIRRVVEFYVKLTHDRLSEKQLKKLVDSEIVNLKKRNII